MVIIPEEIARHPNPKALTFRLKRDLIPGFSKLVFTKTGNLKAYSPLAESLLNRGDVTKVDMFYEEGGNTLITITRKLIDWDIRSKIGAQGVIGASMNMRGQTPVFVDQIAQNVQTHKSFEPKGAVASLVTKTFNQHVSPSLAAHGGSIEVIDVRLGDDNKVIADIALIGSCDGCGTATTQTLAGAQNAISDVLSEAKNTKSGEPGHRIHLIHFDRFNLVNIPDLALTR